MIFHPNPLLYGANPDFYSTFQLAVAMHYPVNFDALARAVTKAMLRYPYFSICPIQENHQLLLKFNSRPVPVFPDNRIVTLGTEESNGHLLAFGCHDRTIYLNASHYIADGMGIYPLLMTVLYLYCSSLYGTEGLNPEKIRMPGEPVPEGEYSYPFPDAPIECESWGIPKGSPESVYSLAEEAFDAEGLYAYHLHIPQNAMMTKAFTSDGSPISFLSVMLYRALCESEPKSELPVVIHVQHQYRAALNTPLCHHSLVNYIPVVLPSRCSNWHVEQQNTAIRGQIIMGSEKNTDLNAVNRLINVLPQSEAASLQEKQTAMARYIKESTLGKTFGISYVGKLDWCGLDQYVEDIHAYIGEKHIKNMLLIEVMTIGEDFSLTFMQSGRGERYLQAFIEQIKNLDIPVQLVGETRYSLCDTKIL